VISIKCNDVYDIAQDMASKNLEEYSVSRNADGVHILCLFLIFCLFGKICCISSCLC
jgi:hypothetical protein